MGSIIKDTEVIANEEAFFFQSNRELIEEQREVMAREGREQERKDARELHWLKCPKCGCSMSQVELAGIEVESCNECEGLFLDKGELDFLVDRLHAKGFFASRRDRSTHPYE